MLRLRTPSYANVMSTIAVIVAVGTGGAYAANTIGSDDVIDASLRGVDIADETIGGRHIINGKLTYHDLRDETLTGAKVQDGAIKGSEVDESTLDNVPSASSAAFATSAGSATQAGKAPVEGYQVIYRQADFDNTVDKEESVDVPCPAGKRPIGGGGFTYTTAVNTPDNNEVAITGSYPTGLTYGPDDNRPTSWYVTAQATERATYNAWIQITGYAICAKTDMP